ncbi:hypothetical protein [Legionella fairfieldensis]|uniref:hypothetical protein n=1 Tax=Legionella fairfieldensis TaxID=45064 RepID=UPI00048C5746|nr:hypothetical protein [Legionella fairfieldensis]
MRQYNEDEARLQAWRNHLNSVETNRKLKNELLNILNQEEETFLILENFNKKREKLLSNEHGQGFAWTPSFNWFWIILSLFLPSFRKNPTGSRLREALQEEPARPDIIVFGNSEKEIPVTTQLLDNSTYEEALFNAPHKALGDLLTRINNLKINNSESLDVILERLYAIKYRLTPDYYQTILTELFREHPVATLGYYYNHYVANNNDLPEAHEFIEHHLMGEALMALFILPFDTINPIGGTNPNPCIFEVQRILLLLALESKIPPLSLNSFLTSMKEEGIDKSELPSQLNNQLFSLLFTNLNTTGKDESEKLKEQKELKGEINNLLQTATNFKTSDQLLHAIFSSNKLNLDKQQPLMVQVARQACELLLEKSEQREQNTGHPVYEFLMWLSEQILNSKKDVDEAINKSDPNSEAHRFNRPAVSTALLSPYIHGSQIPENYQRSTHYATIVIMNYLSSRGKEDKSIHDSFASEHAIKTFNEDKMVRKNPLKNEEIHWFVYYISRISPELAEKAKACILNLQVATSESNSHPSALVHTAKHSFKREKTTDNCHFFKSPKPTSEENLAEKKPAPTNH